MNDRLKFRVWSKKSKRYTGNNASYSIDESGLLHVHIFGQHYELGNTEDFEVEQCTGLKDKNGNLIYEGDIVKCDRDFNPDGRVGLIRKVVFDYGAFKLSNDNDSYFISAFHNIEIIGNIHEQKDK